MRKEKDIYDLFGDLAESRERCEFFCKELLRLNKEMKKTVDEFYNPKKELLTKIKDV